MQKTYKILIMGASYGSLLGTKLALAGHSSIALLPCCHATDKQVPEAVMTRWPKKDAVDLARIFRLHQAGWRVIAGKIEDDITIQSMWDKRSHATYVVSNLCFDADTIAHWLRRMRKRGITQPVLIGLPGPVERAKLMSMAGKIGVGQSVKFLRSHVGTFARIAAPGGYSPEKFLEKLGRSLADPELGVAGLHLFTFNQVTETEEWRQGLLA